VFPPLHIKVISSGFGTQNLVFEMGIHHMKMRLELTLNEGCKTSSYVIFSVL
jgi:hypothetical protein